MAKYKIKVIGLLLKNNKMAEFGELVEETNFSTPVADLVKGGYVSIATQADYKKIKDAEAAKKSEADYKKIKDAEAAKKSEADKKAKEAQDLLDNEAKELAEQKKKDNEAKELAEQKKKDNEAETQRLKDEEDAAKALLDKK